MGAGGHDGPACVRPSLPPVTALSTCIFPPFLHLFQRRFAIVAALTQALEVCRIDEQQPVTPMGLDVIHHGGPGADTMLGALPAPGLPQELSGPKLVRPEGQAVPGVALCRSPAGRPLGLVSGTIPLPCEFRASGMPARSERLHGHGLSPPGKTKSRHRRSPSREVIGTGLQRSTGHLRYSRCTLPCSSGTRGSDPEPVFPGQTSGLWSACSWDRRNVRSLWIVYHTRTLLSTFSLTFYGYFHLLHLVSRPNKDARAILFSACAVA